MPYNVPIQARKEHARKARNLFCAADWKLLLCVLARKDSFYAFFFVLIENEEVYLEVFLWPTQHVVIVKVQRKSGGLFWDFFFYSIYWKSINFKEAFGFGW